jgi:hypothetical protein
MFSAEGAVLVHLEAPKPGAVPAGELPQADFRDRREQCGKPERPGKSALPKIDTIGFQPP